jgi:hypothetical protein
LAVGENPLYQGYDTDNFTPTPDWSNAAYQPTITPQVEVSGGDAGIAVGLSQFRWEWNGEQLSFDATSGIDSYKKFKINWESGALTIIDNLAGAANTANDVLTFRCVAEYDGIQSEVAQSIDVIIQPLGANTYYGYIYTTNNDVLINDSSETITATAQLMKNGVPVTSGVTYKWYKNDLDTKYGEGSSVTIGAGDVDGVTTFICKYYVDGVSVEGAALTITDATDEYYVAFTGEKEFSEKGSTQVKAVLMKHSASGEDSEVSGVGNWTLTAYDGETLDEIGTLTNPSITVMYDTDNSVDDTQGVIKAKGDIAIIADVTF